MWNLEIWKKLVPWFVVVMTDVNVMLHVTCWWSLNFQHMYEDLLRRHVMFIFNRWIPDSRFWFLTASKITTILYLYTETIKLLLIDSSSFLCILNHHAPRRLFSFAWFCLNKIGTESLNWSLESEVLFLGPIQVHTPVVNGVSVSVSVIAPLVFRLLHYILL